MAAAHSLTNKQRLTHKQLCWLCSAGLRLAACGMLLLCAQPAWFAGLLVPGAGHGAARKGGVAGAQDGTMQAAAGLLVLALGLCSAIPALRRWNLVYFRLTYLPTLVTAGAIAMHVANRKLPAVFLHEALAEASVAVLTVLCLYLTAQKGDAALVIQLDAVTAVQLVYGLVVSKN